MYIVWSADNWLTTLVFLCAICRQIALRKAYAGVAGA